MISVIEKEDCDNVVELGGNVFRHACALEIEGPLIMDKMIKINGEAYVATGSPRVAAQAYPKVIATNLQDVSYRRALSKLPLIDLIVREIVVVRTNGEMVYAATARWEGEKLVVITNGLPGTVIESVLIDKIDFEHIIDLARQIVKNDLTRRGYEVVEMKVTDEEVDEDVPVENWYVVHGLLKEEIF